MPFQDFEETPVADVLAPPSAVERWLRKIFIEDIGLKLLALAITLFIWIAVSSENNPITMRAEVQLNFLKPDNLEIGNDPPKVVQVLLTGRKSKLDNIKLPDLVATVDLREYRAGERTVRLSPQRVGIALPEGIKVESYEPTSISVQLEPPMEVHLPVEVRLGGQPAAGFEVYSTQSFPGSVRVRGPASHVSSLQRAATEAVLIDGKKESFNISNVSINIPDQKVEALDSFVNVSVQIGEKRSANVSDHASPQKQESSLQRSNPAGPH